MTRATTRQIVILGQNFNLMTINDWSKKTRIKMTLNHTGKMTGYKSLSTNPKTNSRCEYNASVKGSICEKCYSCTMCKNYSNLDKMLIENGEHLKNEVLTDLPLIMDRAFRFESFGDLETEIQFFNYCLIALANKETTFAIWTKNPDIIAKAFEVFGFDKPNNMIIIYSPLFVNPNLDTDIIKVYPFIDKIFSVFTSKYAIENDITINCGKNVCAFCGKCYNRNDTTTFINEVVKEEQNKYYKAIEK